MKIQFLILFAISFLLLCISSSAQQATRLSENVNSAYEEREPILSPDGNQLYIWRRKHPQNAGGAGDQGDVWVSNRLSDFSYSRAVPFNLPLNSSGLEFLWQISPTGDTLFVSQVLSNRDPGLYYMLNRPGEGRRLKRLYVKDFFPRGKHRDYIITSQGDLLIPNQSIDGFGGPDIYISFRINDTTWGKPVNLGPTINTRGDEDAPFLLPDGKTLFFNSNGHESNGLHDVYFSTRLDDSWQNWSKPQPIGAPINTPNNEADFVVTDDGEMAYWISDHQSRASYDIYQMRIAGCELDVYPLGDQVMCEGETLELQAGFTLSDSPIRYQWQRDGQDLPGETNRSLSVRASGNYQVIRYKEGCENVSSPSQVTVIPSPKVNLEAETFFICEEDSIRLFAHAPEAASWEWVKNGLSIPRANRPELWIKYPGTYAVKVSNGTCGAETKAIRIGKMKKPVIYPSDQAVIRSRPLPNEWLWTQEFSDKKEKFSFSDMSSDAAGRIAVLGYEAKGKKQRSVLMYFDEKGNQLWKKTAEAYLAEAPHQLVKMDVEGNIFVLDAQHFLTKYDNTGRKLWSKDGDGNFQPAGLAVDPLGHVITFVYYRKNPSLGGQQLPNRDDGGACLQKFDPWGQLKWTRNQTTSPPDVIANNHLGCDPQGNIYLAGAFQERFIFDGDDIINAVYSEANAFLARYFPDGQLHWARRHTSGASPAQAQAVYTDAKGSTYFLFEGNIFRYDPYGRQNWKAPALDDAQYANLAQDRQGTLFCFSLSDSRTYSLQRVDKQGNSIQLWSQKSLSKSLFNRPTISANAEGKLFVSGIANGKAPSKADINLKPAFIAAFGPPPHEDKLPVISLCPGEHVDLIVDIPRDIPYYWTKDGRPIQGATDTLLHVTSSGTYSVRAFSGACEQYANTQQIETCYQAVDQTDSMPEQIAEVPKPQPKPVTKPKPKPEVKPAPIPEPEEPKADVKTTSKGIPTSIDDRKVSKQGAVKVSSPKVKISVWDRGAVDNDTISLNVNGVWLVERYALKKQARVFEVEFDENGNNYIILYAHNLGIIPPNTATVAIDDGENRQVLNLKSNMNDCGSINVKLGKR